MRHLLCILFAVSLFSPLFFVVYKEVRHEHAWHWVDEEGGDYEAAIDKAHSRASARLNGRNTHNFEYYLGLEMVRLGWHKEDWAWCCEEGE